MTTMTLNDATMAVACKEGDVMTASNLLQEDPDIFHRSIPWTDKDQKELITPPIFIAVDYGHLDLVQSFLQIMTTAGGDDDDAKNKVINIVDSNDYTPLQWASWNGNVPLVQYLISQNARVDQDALDLARDYDHLEVVQILKERIDYYHGLDDTVDIDEIMIKASREGDIVKVQELVAKGYDFNKWKDEKSNDGSYQEYSPIYIAMKNGHVDLIREFMAAGVEAELHSTHFHYDENNDNLPPPPKVELTEEQIAEIVKAMKEEEDEAEEGDAADSEAKTNIPETVKEEEEETVQDS